MEKKERPIDRIRDFSHWLIANKVIKTEIAFERICGFSKHYIKNLCATEKGNVGVDSVAAIYDRFPAISLKWIITGKGGMFGNRNEEDIAEQMRMDMIEYEVRKAKDESVSMEDALKKVLKTYKDDLTAEEKVALLERLI